MDSVTVKATIAFPTKRLSGQLATRNVTSTRRLEALSACLTIRYSALFVLLESVGNDKQNQFNPN